MQIQVQQFYVANLGTNHFILGFPWLYEFNPKIDWRRHTANGLPLHLCPTTKTAEDTLAANLIRTAKDMHSRLAWMHECVTISPPPYAYDTMCDSYRTFGLLTRLCLPLLRCFLMAVTFLVRVLTQR